METILAGFAQFDNDIRALRTVQGMKKRLQEGIFPWKPPMGYKTPTLQGERKTKPDLPSEPVFGILQRAWKEYATGSYTKAEILRLMANWGIATRHGEPLSPQSLDNILRNPYYAGILTNPWTGEEHEGKHVPMVSREDFARVQRIIARNHHGVHHRTIRPEFPLRGLVRCPVCQSFMTASLSRGRSRQYAYYRCNASCGTGTSYPAAPIHEEFVRFLQKLRARSELLNQLGEVIIEAAEERRDAAAAKHARLERDIAAMTRQIQALITMRTEGLIDDQEFATQRRSLTQRRASLEVQRNADRFNPTIIRRYIEQIKAPLSDPQKTWRNLPPTLQRRFQRTILPAGFVKGRIGTANKALLFSVLDDLSRRETSLGSFSYEIWNRLIAEIQNFSAIFDLEDEEKSAA